MNAHNIGANRPRLSHRDFVTYLYECAARWYREPNGFHQSVQVFEHAQAMELLDEDTCPVCKRQRGMQ